MVLSYSNVIDWVANDTSIAYKDAARLLTPVQYHLVETMLVVGGWCKLSFGLSDEDVPGEVWADFTPRRLHPLALDYGRWIAKGPTIDTALANAIQLYRDLMSAALVTLD